MADITHVTDADFSSQVLEAAKPVVVDFWAPWCGPCLRLAPILEEVAQELEDRCTVMKLNTDENPASAQKFGVMSIPTLIVFKGGQEATRLVGLMSKADLKQRLEQAIA